MSRFGKYVLRSERLSIGVVPFVIKSGLRPHLTQVGVLAYSHHERTGFYRSPKVDESIALVHPQCRYDGFRVKHPTHHELIARKGHDESQLIRRIKIAAGK